MARLVLVALLAVSSAAISPVPTRSVALRAHAGRVQGLSKNHGIYGDTLCPCIGLAHTKGETTADCGGGTTIQYPTEFGSSCQTWDASRHPDCETGTDSNFTSDGESPAWCSQPWCFVDPCKCNIPDMPQVSTCLPGSTYQDHPVYYSYSTCGGKDEWTGDMHAEACVNQYTQGDCMVREKCAWDGLQCYGKEIKQHCNHENKVDEAKFGSDKCKCMGIHNLPGTMEADVFGDGKKLSFPADVGATCRAWGKELHPSCKGDKPQAWCEAAWCFVDACDCAEVEPPKLMRKWFGENVTVGGRQVYYSYTTCGSDDPYPYRFHPEAASGTRRCPHFE